MFPLPDFQHRATYPSSEDDNSSVGHLSPYPQSPAASDIYDFGESKYDFQLRDLSSRNPPDFDSVYADFTSTRDSPFIPPQPQPQGDFTPGANFDGHSAVAYPQHNAYSHLGVGNSIGLPTNSYYSPRPQFYYRPESHSSTASVPTESTADPRVNFQNPNWSEINIDDYLNELSLMLQNAAPEQYKTTTKMPALDRIDVREAQTTLSGTSRSPRTEPSTGPTIASHVNLPASQSASKEKTGAPPSRLDPAVHRDATTTSGNAEPCPQASLGATDAGNSLVLTTPSQIPRRPKVKATPKASNRQKDGAYRHMEKTVDGRFGCRHCKKSFKDCSSFRRHWLSECYYNGRRIAFGCSDCTKYYPRKWEVKRHCDHSKDQCVYPGAKNVKTGLESEFERYAKRARRSRGSKCVTEA